jgi:hypothetical protein
LPIQAQIVRTLAYDGAHDQQCIYRVYCSHLRYEDVQRIDRDEDWLDYYLETDDARYDVY